ncbi:WD repeat and HMG-box DNA-binding protein 1 isoform X2 [Fopius arisanus]|nr:PREDICTED: WD repeat and HMG-box DNA-binding protein 1 isoform X2 [Fopius arisanus]XP_011312327.1 PREDICTED: WD repeat and HMG-box DNA-binding protein 1 isoform X2 [Fopius arisanus]
MDDDPSDSCIAEQATCCISKSEKIYVGNDNNTVQILTYPDLEKSGIVTRFSSTVSCLAATQTSNLLISGSCDMRIHVTNLDTSTTTELQGHEAPILAVSLDPKEEFVASSSGDGTLRVWSIKDKKSIQIWNVVPKCNSFFTAKIHSVPSFEPTAGKYLAYPYGLEVIVTERGTWKELFRLTSPNLKRDINICKFSECGTRLAASSVIGEVIVWNVATRKEIGAVEHHQKSKITCLVWHLKTPTELTFCDSLGQLGSIDVPLIEEAVSNSSELATNGQDMYESGHLNCKEDDDDENVISLSKLKASILEDDAKSHSDVTSVHEDKQVLSDVHLQEPFQPGSTPVHLLSRFMMWNDVGIVKCYKSEDDEDSSIEVEFHDTSVHHSMHMNNYLRHTMAALSTEALALSCPSNDEEGSKLLVIMLQVWDTGNKEWNIDLPANEESRAVAAGSNFVALATSKRYLRFFMITGVQREVVAIPGSIVAMNALANHLVVAYHSGVGISNDQQMSIMLFQVRRGDIKCQTIPLALSPQTELMWLGMTDHLSPASMDADGVLRIYSTKSNLWRVAADTGNQIKGKIDHYFIIGISEKEKSIRCVLCKGSHYPATTPRPTVIEIPFDPPLCEIDVDRTKKEAAIWQIGSSPEDEDTALFTLIGYFCSHKLEHCVVDLCQNVAKQSLIELAIKYAMKTDRIALAKKLQAIAEARVGAWPGVKENEDVVSQDMFQGIEEEEDEKQAMEEEILLTPIGSRKPETIEIKPLSLSFKRGNPFLKKQSTVSSNALDGMNMLSAKSPKKTPTITVLKPKSNPKLLTEKKNTFVSWFEKKKQELQEEFPHLSPRDLTKIGLERYKSESDFQDFETKKRKLSGSESPNSEAKRPASKLIDFAFRKD